MVRRTKADAQATRHQILDAAEGQFLAHGVAHTRLQDVAAAAGVTRGAIYWHFQDKAELFNAMMDRALLPCECAAERALAAVPTGGLAQLEEMALAPLRAMAGSAQVQRVFQIAMHQTEYTAELAPVKARYLEGIADFRQQMTDVLERAREAGELRPGLAPPTIALGLFALVDGLMHHWTLLPDGFDLVACGEAVVRTYLGGVRAATAPGGAATASAPAAPAAAPRGRRSRPAPST